MPTLGSIWEDEGSSFHSLDISNEIPNAPVNRATNLGSNVVVGPLIPDFTVEAAGTIGNTLRDIANGQDWRLKSIVGQATFFITPGGPTPGEVGIPWSRFDYWTWVQVALGFFVARALDDDPSSPDLTQDEFDPFNVRNVRNSWIFRRTWILANPANGVKTQSPLDNPEDHPESFSDELFTNRDFAGDMSGPTIRTKSVRRIKTEERLWYTVGILGWDGGRVGVGGTTNLQPGCKFNLDLRIFGSLARAANRQSF